MTEPNTYAVDLDLPFAGVMAHNIEDDGRTLVSILQTDVGTWTSRVTWATVASAEAHYEAARQDAKSVALKKYVELTLSERKVRNNLRTLIRTDRGELILFSSVGPPTWWKPSLQCRAIGYRGIRAGWLNLAFSLQWETDRPRKRGRTKETLRP